MNALRFEYVYEDDSCMQALITSEYKAAKDSRLFHLVLLKYLVPTEERVKYCWTVGLYRLNSDRNCDDSMTENYVTKAWEEGAIGLVTNYVNMGYTYVKSKDLDLWHVITNAKGERKYLALKAKKESSDEECLTSISEDEEYVMAVRDFKKFFKRRECPKPPKDKNQRAFVEGSWSDSGEEDDEKVKDETCLVAQASNEICLGVDLETDEWIKDIGCSKHMTGNRKLFSSYKAYNGDEEKAIKVNEKKNLENDIEDETLEIDEIVNIKESRNHPLENVIRNLNQKTLRSQSQKQSNFFCFISTIEPKNVNEALTNES
ncbi:hypothetical protein Tco_1050011 [Tanacetum coccineum]